MEMVNSWCYLGRGANEPPTTATGGCFVNESGWWLP